MSEGKPRMWTCRTVEGAVAEEMLGYLLGRCGTAERDGGETGTPGRPRGEGLD
jgi:hypothetical protein